jgi:type IV secretion system protein VirB8
VQKRGVPLPTKRMVATITYDFASGRISSSDMNVNPLGFVVTSYRVDQEATP